MSDLFLRPLFTWRSAVASSFGPPSPVTRHVLLTLSLHMSERGDSCFPSNETLATETGLSLRSVKEHLQAAAGAGWIGKRDRRMANTRGWRRVEYFAQIPPEVEAAFHAEQRGAPDAPASGGAPNAPRQGGAPDAPAAEEIGERGAPDSEGGAPRSEGGAPGAPEYTKSTSKRAKKKGAETPLPPDFKISDQVRDWAKRNGYEPYLQAHFDHFLDYAKAERDGKAPTYSDWDAAFRNSIRSDWGRVRETMRRDGRTAPASRSTDTGCRELVAGEPCGMPGRSHPTLGFQCDGHRRKETERMATAGGEMPPHIRDALAKFKRGGNGKAPGA